MAVAAINDATPSTALDLPFEPVDDAPVDVDIADIVDIPGIPGVVVDGAAAAPIVDIAADIAADIVLELPVDIPAGVADVVAAEAAAAVVAVGGVADGGIVVAALEDRAR